MICKVFSEILDSDSWILIPAMLRPVGCDTESAAGANRVFFLSLIQ